MTAPLPCRLIKEKPVDTGLIDDDSARSRFVEPPVPTGNLRGHPTVINGNGSAFSRKMMTDA